MADLDGKQASQSVKITGADPATGDETNYVDVDSNGAAKTTMRDPVSGAGITTTADGTKTRLDVDANVHSGQLVPTITNKFRIHNQIADVILPNTGTYVTLYSRSGSGLFFGFQVEFDSSKVNIRLTLDGGVVFDINLDDIRKFKFNDTSTTRVQMGGFLTTIGNVLDFSSKYAIPYSTTVLIEAASSDSANHKNKNWILFQTEDT